MSTDIKTELMEGKIICSLKRLPDTLMYTNWKKADRKQRRKALQAVENMMARWQNRQRCFCSQSKRINLVDLYCQTIK